ncbi:MAG: RNA polymerase sigma factor [Anaerolineales bacterium]|jgi:RNA polymerase sigma-70 factor (ECF subfamily)
MSQRESGDLDSELLSQAAKGDRKSFGAFYERFIGELYRYVYLRIGDHEEAEDLTETVFLKAWEALTGESKDQRIRNIRAWIYRIAHNTVVDHYRARKNTVSIDETLDKSLRSTWLEREVDDAIISQKMAKGIMQLPSIDQRVIILRFVNQMSHAEVAQILQVREGHVRVLQYRALKRLRNLLSEI